MKMPVYTELNSNTCSAKYNAKYFPEFYNMLIEKYPDAISFPERIYCYFNNLDIIPTCPVCGKNLIYRNFKRGYSKYCSQACCQNDPTYKEKVRQSNLEKYGTEYASQSQEVKDKTKKTNLERYGVENAGSTQTSREKARRTNLEKYCTEYASQSQEVKDKTKKTNLERYGVENISSLKETRKRVADTNLKKYGGTGFGSDISMARFKDTCLKKYGTTNINDVKEIKAKIKQGTLNYLMDKDPHILSIYSNEENRRMYLCSCPDCACDLCTEKQYNIYSNVYSNRLSNNIDTCTIRNPYNTIKNTTIECFIKEILDEYGIEYITNDRSILCGRELDIYIPSHKLAVECNGVYFHDDIHKDKTFHYNKYEACKSIGIQLLTIWSDWINTSPDKVKSIILSKLGIYKIRIGARECSICEIYSKECAAFLNKYHLQGNTNSSIRYGLYYKDELVSVMTFGRKRNMFKHKASKDSYELYRYCCKSGVQVIGGAEKLLKAFIAKYNPVYIESFSSNDISNGDLYKKLGFVSNNVSTISYWYICLKTNIRYHRYTFSKWKLVKEGYDKDKSEHKIMSERGFVRIYDSGTVKWVLNL